MAVGERMMERLIMAYWIRTLGHWWEYVGTYVVISIIGTAILGFFVAGDPDGLFGLAENARAKPGNPNGIALMLAIIFLGPLFNAYTAIIAAKCAIEADDDYHWSLKKLNHLPHPTAGSRKKLVAVLTFLPGLLLLPFTFWMYTAKISWLWSDSAPAYMRPGIYVSVLLVVFIYAVVPKVFLSAVGAAFELEEQVTEKISKE